VFIAFGLVEIAPGIDLHGIAIGKFPDIFGKLAWLRHVGSADQQRDDGDVPIERGLDLDTDIVGLGVDSGTAVSAAAHPARPHDDHQHIAVLNACPNVFAKIQSWRDAVDVAKDSLATITAGEPVEDAAGDVHRIVTTIGIVILAM